MAKTIQQMYEEIKPLLDIELMDKEVIEAYRKQLSLKYVGDVDEIIGEQFVILQNEKVIEESQGDTETEKDMKENAEKMIKRSEVKIASKTQSLPYYKDMLLVYKQMLDE